MKTYTAIYSTESLNNINYAFQATDGNAAKRFCSLKFDVKDIIIRDEETGEEFPMVDEYLTDNAYISKCMVSNKYYLYINNTWDGKNRSFAPVIDVTKDIVPETVINEYNECVARKSTHTFGKWYVGFPITESGGYIAKHFCEKYGELSFSLID